MKALVYTGFLILAVQTGGGLLEWAFLTGVLLVSVFAEE
jgi:hypothetical protein